MKKLNKVIIIFFIIIVISIHSYGKYNYNYKLNAFSLIRDNSEIVYNLQKDVKDGEFVNRDVKITIDFNKEIEGIEGFELSENKKSLKRIIQENETSNITVNDLSGNKKQIEYSINNIDKIPPEIVGIEDGKIYNTNVNLEYKDNIGVKNIYVDRYSSLNWPYHPDYYDTSFYKGIDINSNSVIVKLSGHPKGTNKYKYFINNSLKAEIENTTYTFIGLNPGTNYLIRVEAIDKFGNVLSSIQRNVKTKYCKNITGVKNDKNKTFSINLSGIDSRIKSATCIGFINNDIMKAENVSISSDRKLNYTFYALDLTNTLQNGYYYFHVQLWDANNNLVETICSNIIFNTNYKENIIKLNPYKLTYDGNYQIIATDLAGNETEKNIVIKKY